MWTWRGKENKKKKRKYERRGGKNPQVRALRSQASALIPISQVEATTTAASPSSSTYVLIFMIDLSGIF